MRRAAAPPQPETPPVLAPVDLPVEENAGLGEEPSFPEILEAAPRLAQLPPDVPDAQAVEPALGRDDDVEEEESEEAFSIRTRSMAEVLAEQGDISGALDIYQELMQTAGPDEKTSLMARAEELGHRMTAGPVSETSRAEEKTKVSGGESTRLVSLLESLAQRLEARAR